MKRVLNIFSCIAIILMSVACLAKVMHWPGASVMSVLSFGFLSLVYLPGYYIYKRKEMINWKERFRTGFGIFCISLFLLGVLFKSMHWPGAGSLLVLSMSLFSFVFIPIYTVLKFRKAENKAEKAMHIFGGILVSCIILGIAFKIMHWPGAGLLLILSVFFLLFGYLPCFVAALKKDSENRSKKFLRLYVIVTIVGTWITMSLDNTSISIITSFCLVDERIDEGNRNLSQVNNIVYSSLSHNAAIPDSTEQRIKKVHELRIELYNYIQRMKSELYVKLAEMSPERADSAKLADLGPKDNYDTPSFMLIGSDPGSPREGDLSAKELKNKIAVFKMDLLSLVDDRSRAELNKVIGLSTYDIYDKESQSETPWESYYFWHVPVVTVITTLSQMQGEVLYSESSVILYLNNKYKTADTSPVN